jgi:hypothetical protein
VDLLRKPLICFGQDEAIMKQYCFTSKSWTAPTGQKVIIPKDDGMGVMISAFFSREFGFGLQLCQQQLQKVNEVRHATKYSDEEAGKEIRGKTYKDPLDNSPFVLQFEYGANNQGSFYRQIVKTINFCLSDQNGILLHLVFSDLGDAVNGRQGVVSARIPFYFFCQRNCTR